MRSARRDSAQVEAIVNRYFATRYPARGTVYDLLGFRRSHDATAHFISSLGLRLDSATLLDYGCGDGELLAAVLQAKHGGARGLHVKLVEPACEERYAAVRRIAPLVASVTECALLEEDDTKHDIVLAIGVLDYYPNWRERLRLLAGRASSCLIVTMPRRRCGGHLTRRIWLRAHGIAIQRVTPAELRSVARAVCKRRTILRGDRSTLHCAMLWA